MHRYISYRHRHVLLLMLMVLMLLWFETCQVTAAASETQVQVIDNERPTRTGAQINSSMCLILNIQNVFRVQPIQAALLYKS